MSTPTSPNSPDPSAESETRAPEAPDVSQNDPTRELDLPATEAGAEPTKAVTEPTKAVTEPTKAVAEPTKTVAEPTETVAEPTDSVGEPAGAATAEDPLSQFSEPTREHAAEPTTVWSEPTAPLGTTAVATATATGPEPKAPTGPHLPAILLGVTCLIVAIIAIAEELGRLTIDWGNVGPLGIVAAGAVLVILGLVGLLASRKKS
jgi:hypothetical protein